MTKANNKVTGSSTSTLTRSNPSMVTTEMSRSGRLTSKGGHTKTASLTHEQIAARAKSIWQKKGCPSGQDKANWLEAETQLKRELGIE